MSDIKDKMHHIEFTFRWGFDPDPAWGANGAPPDPLAVFKRAYF